MSKFNFQRVIDQLERSQSALPKLLANQAQNYFVNNFKKESFDGKPWKQVKRRIPGTPEYKYPKKKRLSRRTKKILIGTGALRRATSNSIKESSFKRIRLVVSLPYAHYHNDGTNKLPKRRFMGQTRELSEMQMKLIKKEIDRAWRV